MLVQRLVRLTTVTAAMLVASPTPTMAKPGKPKAGASKTNPGATQTGASKALLPEFVSRYVPCYEFSNVRNSADYVREIGGCSIGGGFNHIDLALTLDPPKSTKPLRLSRIRCWGQGTDPKFKNRIKAKVHAIEDPNMNAPSQTLVQGTKSFQGGRGELGLLVGKQVDPDRFHYVLGLEWRDGNSQGNSQFEGCRVEWAVYD